MDDLNATDPYVLLGCALQDGDLPNFAIPLFRNLENGCTCIHVVGEHDKIVSFQLAKLNIDYAISENKTTYKIGMDPVVALAISATNIVFGSKNEINDLALKLLASGSLDRNPLLALDIAKSAQDDRSIQRLQSLIYGQTLQGLPKAQKFFLENNVAREVMLRNTDAQSRSDISKLRIDIEGDRINVISIDKSYNLSPEMGKSLIRNVQVVTGIDEPQLSFHHFEGHDSSWRSEFNEMKYGFPALSGDVFDNGGLIKFLTYKDAICIIPELAAPYISGQRSSSEILDTMIETNGKVIGVSKPTALKSIRLQPVAMRSAQLLRFWVLKTLENATSSRELRVHLSCIVLNAEKTKIVSNLRDGQVVEDGSFTYRPVVFTYSMICYLLRHGIIELEDVLHGFMYSTIYPFSRSRFKEKFIHDWTLFATTEFRSYSAEDIAGIIAKPIPDVKARTRLL